MIHLMPRKIPQHIKHLIVQQHRRRTQLPWSSTGLHHDDDDDDDDRTPFVNWTWLLGSCRVQTRPKVLWSSLRHYYYHITSPSTICSSWKCSSANLDRRLFNIYIQQVHTLPAGARIFGTNRVLFSIDVWCCLWRCLCCGTNDSLRAKWPIVFGCGPIKWRVFPQSLLFLEWGR